MTFTGKFVYTYTHTIGPLSLFFHKMYLLIKRKNKQCLYFNFLERDRERELN